MPNKPVEKLAEQFILTYLGNLRHKASMLTKRDWGLFPFYWYRPSKITIFITMWNDLAISIDRIVKGKEDKITIRKAHGRIEETHFPNLNYNTWGLFGLKHENAHHILIEGGTYDIGTHPFIKLRNGVEVRFLRIRVEARVRGYPRDRMFLWFLTNPIDKKHLSKERAESEAELEFWAYLQHLVTTRFDYLLARGIEVETFLLLQKSIEHLKEEYIQLISRRDLDEQMLQNFLENHYFLLSPRGKVEKTKRKLGPYIPDFILRHVDDTFTLVEIQLNRDPIIQNNQPSSGMKEAVKQLKDWFEWIDSNEPSMLSRYSGLIVIGRQESYRKNESVIKNILSKIGYPVSLLTYDDLEGSINYIMSQLVKTKKD